MNGILLWSGIVIVVGIVEIINRPELRAKSLDHISGLAVSTTEIHNKRSFEVVAFALRISIASILYAQ